MQEYFKKNVTGGAGRKNGSRIPAGGTPAREKSG